MGILRADRITGLGGANAIKGSVDFGSSDLAANNKNLAITNASDLDIGAGNYTIEYWFNCVDSSSDGFNTSVALSEYTNTSSDSAFNLYHYNKGFRIFNRTGGGFVELSNPTDKWIPSKWHHFAWVRSGTGTNENAIYVDGVSVDTFTNAVNYTSGQHWLIGANFYTGSEGYGYDPEYGFSGHLSNVRVSNVVRYSGAFTPPTAEFSVDSNTILLACQSSGNILQEATGKEVTYYRGSVNSAPPQASRFTPNSPVGFSTTTDVGSQYGSTFDGFGSFATSTYMVPPGGNTRERNRGRGVLFGGYHPSSGPAGIDEIHYLDIQSMGNAVRFGDLSISSYSGANTCASSTRALKAGGATGPGSSNPNKTNNIEFVTIATTGNSKDFGDLLDATSFMPGGGNQTRGIWMGGEAPGAPGSSAVDTIQFVTIATAGNATDFGNLRAGSSASATGASPTRMLAMGGGNPSGFFAYIDYVEIATTGNASDFGDMSTNRNQNTGVSSNTRAVAMGGNTPSGLSNVMEFVTIATTGDATDFGDLTSANEHTGSVNNSIRGVLTGGRYPSYANIMEFITIATTGNGSDFGDLPITGIAYVAGASDSHGGLS